MKHISKYIGSIKMDIEFRIGSNAHENFDLIDDSHPNDLWFHVSQSPYSSRLLRRPSEYALSHSSCHVVAKIHDNVYDKKQQHKIAIQGAILCKQFSKYKSERSVSIMVAPIHCITKTKKIGCVTVDVYSTIVI